MGRDGDGLRDRTTGPRPSDSDRVRVRRLCDCLLRDASESSARLWLPLCASPSLSVSALVSVAVTVTVRGCAALLVQKFYLSASRRTLFFATNGLAVLIIRVCARSCVCAQCT